MLFPLTRLQLRLTLITAHTLASVRGESISGSSRCQHNARQTGFIFGRAGGCCIQTPSIRGASTRSLLSGNCGATDCQFQRRVDVIGALPLSSRTQIGHRISDRSEPHTIPAKTPAPSTSFTAAAAMQPALGTLPQGEHDNAPGPDGPVLVNDPSNAGRADAFRSKAAREYFERRKESTLREQERGKRDMCERCRRARKMCLCASLPAEAIQTNTRFVILQHPAETRRRITGTVPLVLDCLENCHRVVMHSAWGMQPNEDSLRKVLGLNPRADGQSALLIEDRPLLLFPCPGAEFLEDIAAGRQASEDPGAYLPWTQPRKKLNDEASLRTQEQDHCHQKHAESRETALPPSPAPVPPASNVVVVKDGTWSQAKQILTRYPFLNSRKPSVAGPGGRGYKNYFPGYPDDGVDDGEEQARGLSEGNSDNDGVGQSRIGFGDKMEEEALCRSVKFRSAGTSEYGFRREPSKECLSTLESIAYTLEVLEPTPNGKEAAACLRTAFSAMVAAQLQARDLIGQPRFVDRKSRTANRRATPKKDVSRS